MKNRYSISALVLAAAVFSAMCLFPSPGSAYCIYNHTNTGFYFCGEGCQSCFFGWIYSGHHSCCPGNHKGCGGHTYISMEPGVEQNDTSNYTWYVPVQVTNHGWVSIFGKCTGYPKANDYCDDLTVKVHDNDGKVIYHGGVRRLGYKKWCKKD